MVENKSFVLRGHLLCSETPQKIRSIEHGYLVCEKGVCAGSFETLPPQFAQLPLRDYGERLIIPGLCDLHLHAPQYAFRGLGMDLELLEWLNSNTFPEEAKYADLAYARKAYGIFAADLKRSATTRACVFGTIDRAATLLLMELLDETGLKTMVGKVNMDRNSPDDYREKTADSLAETERWLEECEGRFANCRPILTPRFTPSCSDTLMAGLGELQKRRRVPMQSHLSENRAEIAWVQQLCPETACYAESYDRYGLLGGDCLTVMAHCVYSGERELALLRERGVFLAHCPQSNENIASGIAPVRSWLNAGMQVGLGSDIAGGFSLSIFRAMSDAIQVSKLLWRLQDESLRPLTVPEAFYLGTRGGGSFFGKVGGFALGDEFDAVVLGDDYLPHPQPLTPTQRLERILYLSDDRSVEAKFVAGRQILGDETDTRRS